MDRDRRFSVTASSGRGRKILLHVLVPSAVSLLLLGAHFSGIPTLRELVVPECNREFGVLENLQNLCLAGIGVLAASFLVRSRRVAGARFEKGLMALVLAGAVFMLLEEIDYGVHYYELLGGLSTGAYAGFRNVHNLGNTSDVMKYAAHAGVALWFVVVPLALAGSASPVLRYVVPSRWFIATVACTVLVMEIASALNNRQADRSRSMSEYRELLTYYTTLLYIHTLAGRR